MKSPIGFHLIRACAAAFLFVASAAVAEPDIDTGRQIGLSALQAIRATLDGNSIFMMPA